MCCFIAKIVVNCNITKGDILMEVLLLINFLWLGVGLYTYLTLDSENN